MFFKPKIDMYFNNFKLSNVLHVKTFIENNKNGITLSNVEEIFKIVINCLFWGSSSNIGVF